MKIVLNFYRRYRFPKPIFTGLFLFFLSLNLSSQPEILQRNSAEIPENISILLQNEHRKLINLNGTWNFSSQDHNLNTNIEVPFCYNFKGQANVSRNFNVDLESVNDWNYLLCCDGINYECEISINGRFIDKHEGGFSQFSSLIPEGVIKDADNFIDIKLDNYLDYSKTLPLKNTVDYPKNYGGIYRDIYIIAVPKVFIKQINLSSEIDINFNADISNEVTITATDLNSLIGAAMDRKFTVKTEILDTAGTVKASYESPNITISANSTIQQENKFVLSNPQYWSPDNPYLYVVQVSLYHEQELIDVYRVNYGIYEVSQNSNTFLFNEAEFRLKGINYTEEIPGKGISASYQDIENDVRNFKDLGCNVIKVYGKPASTYLIDLCNRYGLLIFEELPVFDVPPNIIGNENFIALSENLMSEIITAHKNNPCIFAYGIGNDFDVSSPESKLYVKRLSSLCKSLDRSLVYYSTRNYNNDICRELVDLVGINIYDRDLKFLKDMTSDVRIKKEKLFISNYGKVINPSNFLGYSDPASIESQSKYIVDFYKIYKNSPLLGSFFISYSDWNSDFPNLKFYDKNDQYLKTAGLYSLSREQRPPAIILRKEFLDEDIPNLNIGTYTKEVPLIFTVIGFFIFIVFIYLANNVRRFRENVWRALLRPFIFFTDVREQNLLPPIQNVILALILSIGNSLFFANIFYYWKDSRLFDIMLSVIVSNESLKTLTNQIIVNPFKLVLVLSIIIFIKIFFISVILWLFSLTLRFRIGYKNIYTVTVWGLLPTIFLLILGIFYIRVLNENPDFVIIGLVAAGFLYLLSIYRILKGTYIIFDTSVIKVYAYGIVTILILWGGILFYMNSAHYLTDYFHLVLFFLKS